MSFGLAATSPKARHRGATGLSYGLVIGLISIVALAAVTTTGSSANSLFVDVGDTLAGPAGLATPTPTPTAEPAPDGFDFVDEGIVSVSTMTESDIVQLTGHAGVNVGISGDGSPEFRLCADATCSSELHSWGTTQQTANDGNYVQMRLTSSASLNDPYTAVLTAGGASVDWVVTTGDCANTSAMVYSSSGKSTVSVPAGCTTVQIKAWAGGAGAHYNNGHLATGGSGGFVGATYSVSPGDQLNVHVGGGGGASYSNGAGGANGGGYGGGGGSGHGGGGGGGRSLVALSTDVADPLVIAGGGGGGGHSNCAGGGGGGGASTGAGQHGSCSSTGGGLANGTGGTHGTSGISYHGGSGGSWAGGDAGTGGKGSRVSGGTGGSPSSQGTNSAWYGYGGGHGSDYGGGGGGGDCNSTSNNNTAGTGTGGGAITTNSCHSGGGGGSAGGGGGGAVHSGGGGGGYGGGAGGSYSGDEGGGGGSSYSRSTDRIGSATFLGANYSTTPNTTDPHYSSPAAQGGTSNNDPGDDGRIVLIFGN